MAGVPPTALLLHPPTCTGCCMGQDRTLGRHRGCAWTLPPGGSSPALREGRKRPIIFHCLKWQPWGDSGLYGNVEEEDQTEGGSLKEAHL